MKRISVWNRYPFSPRIWYPFEMDIRFVYGFDIRLKWISVLSTDLISANNGYPFLANFMPDIRIYGYPRIIRKTSSYKYNELLASFTILAGTSPSSTKLMFLLPKIRWLAAEGVVVVKSRVIGMFLALSVSTYFRVLLLSWCWWSIRIIPIMYYVSRP